MAVTHDVLTDNAKAGRAGRSKANLPTNSAAMCCASAALPPFPNSSTLLPCWNASTRISLTLAMSITTSALRSNRSFTVIEARIDSTTRASKSQVGIVYAPPCIIFRPTILATRMVWMDNLIMAGFGPSSNCLGQVDRSSSVRVRNLREFQYQ